MENKQKTIYRLQLLLFIAGFAIFAGLWIKEMLYGDYFRQMEILFRRGEDFMADFINVLEYSWQRNPYNHELNGFGEKAYLPLSYLITLVVARICKFQGFTEEPYKVGNFELTVIMYIMTLCFVLVFIQLYDLLKGNKYSRIAILVIFALSGVMVFTYERGNLIVLALCGMICFLATYESEHPYIREVGYIALAFAAALKGYPALLGILVLYKKQWIEALRILLYGLLLGVLPFVFFEGGFDNIALWWRNMKLNGELYEFSQNPKVGYHYFIAFHEKILPEEMGLYRDRLKLLVYPLTVLGLIGGTVQKRMWIRVGMAVAVMLMLPQNCGFYCLIYLLPVMVLYFNEEKKRFIDLLYIPLMIIILNPYQMVKLTSMGNWMDYDLYLANIALVVLFLAFVAENIYAVVEWMRERRKVESANGN